jgi:hypothetical protein
MGACCAVWFGLVLSIKVREIKMHAVRFSSVGFKRSSKPNQTNAVRIDSIVAVYSITFMYQTILNIQKKT